MASTFRILFMRGFNMSNKETPISTSYNWVWLRVTTFVLVFSLLFVLISYLFRPIWIGNDVSRNNIAGFYAEPKNTLDVIYIGGSCAITYYCPLVAWNEEGFTSYCYSYNGAFSDFYVYLVREALKTQSPSLFILDLRAFEIRPEAYSENDFHGNVYPGINSMNYSLNRFKAIQELCPKSEYLDMQLDILQYHNRYKQIDKTSFEYIFNRRKNLTKGFATTDATEAVILTDEKNITSCADIYEETEAQLRSLCEYCQERGQQVLFIVPPYASDSSQRKCVYNTFFRIIEEYGFDHLNGNDYYDKIGLDGATDFYNCSHTNLSGATKYTRFLAKYLKSNYTLDDHRNDAKYNQWHIDYENFIMDPYAEARVMPGK